MSRYMELHKLSSPGWTRTVRDEKHAYEILSDLICDGCYIDFHKENLYLPTDIWDLLDTCCGAEYMLEIEHEYS